MRHPFSPRISFGGPITPAVTLLLITFGVTFILQHLGGEKTFFIFGLTPPVVWKKFFFWQLISYIFLHRDIFHLFFNLLGLYIFGCALERQWGPWFFLKYFFICALGAGITTLCFTPSVAIPTVGISGALFGILLAYTFYYLDQDLSATFPFPVRIKYLVLIYGFLIFYFTFRNNGSITNLAHLGGTVFGFFYFNFYSVKHVFMKQIRNYRAMRIRKRYRVVEGGKSLRRDVR